MFNDRDLFVLGTGAVLSVSCLLLPLPFSWKIVLGALVLVSFMILALVRLGPDRIPFEEWLRRRVRYHLQARRYTYQQGNYAQPEAAGESGSGTRRNRGTPSDRTWRERLTGALDGLMRERPEPAAVGPSIGTLRPLSLAVEEVGVYPLTTAFLGVVGVYFLAWLGTGGAGEISDLIGGLMS